MSRATGTCAPTIDRICPSGRRTDGGDTLIEILIVIVILGITGVSLLLGFGTSIFGSSVYRNVATLDTVLRTAAENTSTQLQQQSSTLWGNCQGASQVSFAGQYALPAGYTGQISGVSYWSAGAFAASSSTSSPPFSSPNCVADAPQLVAIQVAYKGVNYNISTVVDDPSAPPVPPAGAASQLVFLTQPGNGSAGVPLGTQPVVAVEDSSGNIVTTDLSSVTLTLTPSDPNASELAQNCTGTEYAGVVSFSNCSVATIGTYSYVAQDTFTSSLGVQYNVTTQSSNFSVVPGTVSASQSSVTASPSIVSANGTSSSTITVALQDAYGNAVPSKSISLSAGSGSSVITAGTNPTNASGVATFTVTDTSAESIVYTATDTTDSIPLAQTPTVAFTYGPSVAISTPASSTIYSSSGTHVWNGHIAGTSTDPTGPGVQSIQVEILATSGAHSGDYWNGSTSSWQTAAVFNTATGTTSWTYNFAIPSDGHYTVIAQGTDTYGDVGNPVSDPTTFDSTGAVASIPTVNGYS
jgi:hypothetical protein